MVSWPSNKRVRLVRTPLARHLQAYVLAGVLHVALLRVRRRLRAHRAAAAQSTPSRRHPRWSEALAVNVVSYPSDPFQLLFA